MTLNQFLTQTSTSMAAFARSVGTTTATISRVADGTVVPRRDLMQRIHRHTEGRVTPNDLIGLFCITPCKSMAETGPVECHETLEAIIPPKPLNELQGD